MTANHARQLLVLPDRDAAEEAAGKLTAEFAGLGRPELVRDALAGEDDAEDAQWLVVLEAPEDGGWSAEQLARLDGLAAEYEGWREED
ncbi:hypothetical protein OG871_13460 [Kitasatospora sp. NBC_00374]|uniref:hypothetical protein n=1 Tax=Kitasatospora sp. NBC_00374 TaxID=2975964 RepID=UPI0032557EC4